MPSIFKRPRVFHPVSVNLHPNHVTIINQLIEKGYATSRSELIRAALLAYFVDHKIQIIDDENK